MSLPYQLLPDSGKNSTCTASTHSLLVDPPQYTFNMAVPTPIAPNDRQKAFWAYLLHWLITIIIFGGACVIIHLCLYPFSWMVSIKVE